MDNRLALMVDEHFQHERNRAAAKAILDQTEVRHLTYPKGPLEAALVIGMVDTGSAISYALSPPWLTYAWLHLRSGQVFMIRLEGDAVRAGIDLPDMVALLDDIIETEVDFAANEKRLNDCLDGCTARLTRFGLIAPNTDFLVDVNELNGIGRIEALAKDEGNPLPEQMWEAFANHFGRLLCEGNSDVVAFTSGLNADALRLIELITHSYGTDARQTLVYNFFASGPAFRRTYRMQAALQLPWLVPMLTGLQLDDWPLDTGPASAWPGSWTEIRSQIIDVIDAGKPLFDFVARLFGVPRNVIGWSRHRVLPDLTRINHRNIDTLLRLLSAIPESLRPINNDEWRKFDQRLNLYFRIIANAHQIPAFLLPLDWSMDGNNRGRTIERILMNWLAEDATYATMGGTENRGVSWSDLEEAMDFITACAEAVRTRLELRYSKRRSAQRHHEAAMLDWLRTISLVDIVCMSRIWHRRTVLDAPEPLPQTTEPVEKHDLPWPVLLPEALTIGSRIIVQLIDRQSLIDEGDALCHCIGAYDGRCRTGGSTIFSIQSLGGDHLSTLELDLMDSGFLTTRGHKAYRNGIPTDDCQWAVMQLVEYLNGTAGMEGRAAMAERRRQVDDGKIVFAGRSDSVPTYGVELAWNIIQGSRHAVLLNGGY